MERGLQFTLQIYVTSILYESFTWENLSDGLSTHLVILDIWHEKIFIRGAFYLLSLEEISSVILASLFPSQFVMLPTKKLHFKEEKNESKNYFIATPLLNKLYLFTRMESAVSR